MCGIAGWIGRDRQNSRIVLQKMTDAIVHRGPDGEGYFCQSIGLDQAVALGHRRLAILDPVGGHQPMVDLETGSQLVFNGEIYNFKELRRELEAKGAIFSTNSDTEVVLLGYRYWQDAMVSKLRGMFAFALWDARQRRMLLARDPFGKKPLFLSEFDGALWFASEMKSLLTVPGMPKTLDQSAVASSFIYRYVPGPSTLIHGIYKLSPGHLAVWTDGCLIERPYYHCAEGELFTSQPWNESAAEAQLLAHLDEAVRLRMVSDVPFGAFLSGGIDSSAIVALMARHSKLPIQTFSVGFSQKSYSELNYAREVAQFFKTNHHEVVVSETDLMDYLPLLVRHRDAPISEPSDIPIFRLSMEASRSVKMVLTGEGSDEILGGYSKYIFNSLSLWWHKLPRNLRYTATMSVRKLPFSAHRLKTTMASLEHGDEGIRLARWFGALSPKEVSELFAYRVKYVPMPPSASEMISPLRRMLFFDQTSWLPDNLLERGDRMTMAASIEARMPFLDTKLAAWAARLPDHYRVRGRTTKWLLRRAMRSLLPESILNRKKMGFRVPVAEWFRGPLRAPMAEQLLGPDSRTSGWYKRRVLERWLTEHWSGRQNHEKLLWHLWNLEIWHREVIG